LKVFSFDPEELAGLYSAQGWIHVPGGATAEFCDYVRDLVTMHRNEPLHGKGIGGSKDQLLLELPEGFDLRGSLLDPIACAAGLDPAGLTISERHVKMYSSEADPSPRPHKDRFASQVALGISIDIPDGSHLVLYPDRDVSVNPLLRAGLIDSLPEERQPQRVLADAPEVVIHDQPGDVVAFRGSSMWHLRRRCASTVIVYFKCNDFGSDPLGEDPRTSARRERTVALSATDDAMLDAVPCLSASFESVTREYGRDLSLEWLNVNLWDRPPFMISALELELLKQTGARRSARELVTELASEPNGDRPALDALRRLCEMGALDLRTADAPE